MDMAVVNILQTTRIDLQVSLLVLFGLFVEYSPNAFTAKDQIQVQWPCDNDKIHGQTMLACNLFSLSLARLCNPNVTLRVACSTSSTWM